MANTPETETTLTRVIFENSDGSANMLVGDEAKKWDEYFRNEMTIASVHGRATRGKSRFKWIQGLASNFYKALAENKPVIGTSESGENDLTPLGQ